MAEISSAFSLIIGLMEAVKKIGESLSFLGGIAEKERVRRVRVYKAVTSIRMACIHSSQFINNYGYQTNNDLVERWHNALNACVDAGMEGDIPQYLYSKAEFWSDPQSWISNPITLELVPKLDDLKSECDNILAQLQN